MPALRVVIDTNVLVSAVAYPASIPGRILSLWSQGSLTVVFSRYILNETARVLPKLPQTKRTQGEISMLVDSFAITCELVEPDTFIEPNLRDPADQQILATLRISNADYLITGDKDLLALADTCSIVTPAAFWQKHG